MTTTHLVMGADGLSLLGVSDGDTFSALAEDCTPLLGTMYLQVGYFGSMELKSSVVYNIPGKPSVTDTFLGYHDEYANGYDANGGLVNKGTYASWFYYGASKRLSIDLDKLAQAYPDVDPRGISCAIVFKVGWEYLGVIPPFKVDVTIHDRKSERTYVDHITAHAPAQYSDVQVTALTYDPLVNGWVFDRG